jgi:hypothetical protein
MSTYAPIVTLDGQAKIADAIENSGNVNISHIGVGDGGGAAIVPLETMVALTNEVWRGAITSAGRDPGDPTRVIFTATIPLEAGPFVIREIAAFTSDGKLFAIGSYPEQQKPTAAQGAVSSIEIEFVVVVAEAASVTLAISPSQLTYLNNLARIPFYAVDAITNDPPSDPAAGAMVIVGTNPNGAFFGHANKVAMWNSSLWALATAPIGTIAGNAVDGKYYRFTGTGWVLWQAGQGSFGPVDLSMFEKMPFFPEVLTSDGRLAITVNGNGTVTINAGQTIRWRGFRDFSTSDFSAGDRTFTTLGSKTYHLRWHPPGKGDAANAANYSNGKFVLKDLAASDYNPSAKAEADVAFDSTYDDVLIARIVTNVSNVATITGLANKDRLTFSKKTGGVPTAGPSGSYSLSVTENLLWGRRPTLAAVHGSVGANSPAPAGSMDGYASYMSSSSFDRYSAAGTVVTDWVSGNTNSGLQGYIEFNMAA